MAKAASRPVRAPRAATAPTVATLTKRLAVCEAGIALALTLIRTLAVAAVNEEKVAELDTVIAAYQASRA